MEKVYPANQGNATVGTSPMLIASEVRVRRGLLITNAGTVTCYLNPNNQVKAPIGYPLLAGASVVTTLRSAQFASTSTSTTTVGYIDDSD